GVVALHATQAELIRRMIQQAPALAKSSVPIQVDVPEGFRQRECSVVVLSLTRSHHHRAVTFGDGPEALLLALTRARRRLIVIGDPSTLARRGQWEGPLDHLDEAAASRERELVLNLFPHFHPEHSGPRVMPVLEG